MAHIEKKKMCIQEIGERIKGQLGKPRSRWKKNFNVDLKEIGSLGRPRYKWENEIKVYLK